MAAMVSATAARSAATWLPRCVKRATAAKAAATRVRVTWLGVIWFLRFVMRCEILGSPPQTANFLPRPAPAGEPLRRRKAFRAPEARRGFIACFQVIRRDRAERYAVEMMGCGVMWRDFP